MNVREYDSVYGEKILRASDCVIPGYKSQLVVNDEKLLRVKSEPVGPNEDVNQLVAQMINELELYNRTSGKRGYGLSAIQLGIPKRVIVMHFQPSAGGLHAPDGWYLPLLNPAKIDEYDSFTYPGEGCMSFPGQSYATKRFEHVHVKDDLRAPGRVFGGALAVALQHELDHLDGVLFMDRKVVSIDVGRNDPCPCGSGKKYKKCTCAKYHGGQ